MSERKDIPHLASNKASRMPLSAVHYDEVPFNMKSSSEKQASNFSKQYTAFTPFVLSLIINTLTNVKVAQSAV